MSLINGSISVVEILNNRTSILCVGHEVRRQFRLGQKLGKSWLMVVNRSGVFKAKFLGKGGARSKNSKGKPFHGISLDNDKGT